MAWRPLGAFHPLPAVPLAAPPLRTHARRPTAALVAIGTLLTVLGIGVLVYEWVQKSDAPPTVVAEE